MTLGVVSYNSNKQQSAKYFYFLFSIILFMKRILSNKSYSFNHIIYILTIHSKNLKDPKNSLKE